MGPRDELEALRRMAALEAKASGGQKPAGPNMLERFGTGAMDVLHGGAQLLVNALPEGVVSAANSAMGDFAPTAPQLNQRLQDRERTYQAERQAGGQTGMDWARIAGNVAGSLPVAAGGGGIGAAMLSGGASGLLSPVTDPQADFWREKLIQGGTGMLAGGAGGVVTKGLSRAISPNVNPAVQGLMDRGITPTPGQILGGAAGRIEEKLTSVPGLGDLIVNGRQAAVGDLNRAAYDYVLEPLGKKYSGEAGREAVSGVADTISRAYDDVLSKVSFAPDQQFITELGALRQAATSLPEREARTFMGYLDDVLPKQLQGGPIPGEAFKKLEQNVGERAATFSKAADGYQNDLGGLFQNLQQSLRSGLERSNPGASELQAVNAAFARNVRLQNAAGRSGGDGLFSPGQLSMAVKATDGSRRKAAFAKGDALMQGLSDDALSVLGTRVPDSGTAGRLAAGAGLLGGGGLLATGAIEPSTAIATGLLALPYLNSTARKAAAAALTKRPNFAPGLAAAVNQYAPLVGTTGAYGLLSPQQ